MRGEAETAAENDKGIDRVESINQEIGKDNKKDTSATTSSTSSATTTTTTTTTRRTQETTSTDPSRPPPSNSTGAGARPKTRGVMLCAGGKNIGNSNPNGGDIMGIVTQVCTSINQYINQSINQSIINSTAHLLSSLLSSHHFCIPFHPSSYPFCLPTQCAPLPIRHPLTPTHSILSMHYPISYVYYGNPLFPSRSPIAEKSTAVMLNDSGPITNLGTRG